MTVDEAFAGLGFGPAKVRFTDVWEPGKTGSGLRYQGLVAAHGCRILLVKSR